MFTVAKIGLFNNKFRMTEPTVTDHSDNGLTALAGPLEFEGRPLARTYVLLVGRAIEGVPQDELGKHKPTADSLELNGAAAEFCTKYGFEPNDHLNSWPVFQAVVTKKETGA